MITALMFVLALNGGLYLGTILYTAFTSNPDRNETYDRPDAARLTA